MHPSPKILLWRALRLAKLSSVSGLTQVRVIKDSSNKNVESAGPSVAVLVGGLNNVPVAGDEFTVMETEQEVRFFWLKHPKC